MGRYLVKRLILFLPVLCTILFFLFFLIKGVSDDDILQALDSDEYGLQNLTDIADRYEAEARKRNLHLPVFYFSFKPGIVHRIKEIEPRLYYRESIKSWLTFVGFEEVRKFHEHIDAAIIENGGRSDVIASLLYLKNADQFSSQKWIKRIALLSPSTVNVTKLVAHFDLMIKKGKAIGGGWPVWQWNGCENQFHKWASNIFKGNWGTSSVDGRPVISKMIQALKWTLTLSFFAILFAYLIGVPFGLWGALKSNSWGEKIISNLFFLFYAIPIFWIATLLIVFFTTDEYGAWTNIFPSVGIFLEADKSFFNTLVSSFKFLILPIICMTIGGLAFIYQQMRSNTLDETSHLYYQIARSKGLSRSDAVVKHAFINAVFPLAGRLGALLPAMISGSIIIEVLFNIPGMGRLLMESIFSQDWETVLGITVLSAILTFIGFILSDILLYFMNPRVKFER